MPPERQRAKNIATRVTTPVVMTPPRNEAKRSAPEVSDTVVVSEPGAGEGSGETISAQRPYLVHTEPAPHVPHPVECPQPSSPQLRLWHAGWQQAPSMHSCSGGGGNGNIVTTLGGTPLYPVAAATVELTSPSKQTPLYPAGPQ